MKQLIKQEEEGCVPLSDQQELSLRIQFLNSWLMTLLTINLVCLGTLNLFVVFLWETLFCCVNWFLWKNCFLMKGEELLYIFYTLLTICGSF